VFDPLPALCLAHGTAKHLIHRQRHVVKTAQPSTLLNLIAGITQPTEGGLLCDNREISGPGPERAVVFQNHSLLPWLSYANPLFHTAGDLPRPFVQRVPHLYSL
jgi:hypothetical protein